MAQTELRKHKLGWIGTGRMGFPMAGRLLEKGADVAVYNRTRAKAEPLVPAGGRLVDSPAALADRDIVFTMVSTSDDLLEVALGPQGVLSRPGRAPRIMVDCSTVSQEASGKVRAAAAAAGCALLAAPVSGNGKVVKAGRLSLVVSGSRAAYDEALPYLEALGEGVTYVGEGELARIVKICHNVFLGVVTQSLAEITVLAEKAGAPRHAFLDFINKSVMGSTFTRYKTPAFVNLDFTPTFTPVLLRKDLDLGLAAARKHDVPMPVAALVREIVQSLIGTGAADRDFATLLELEAKAAQLPLRPEGVPVSDGLEEKRAPSPRAGAA
jgi:3-hydroxyisobutyrate dehydrogenase-like beta-hydroxyacid dehydrogenase